MVSGLPAAEYQRAKTVFSVSSGSASTLWSLTQATTISPPAFIATTGEFWSVRASALTRKIPSGRGTPAAE